MVVKHRSFLVVLGIFSALTLGLIVTSLAFLPTSLGPVTVDKNIAIVGFVLDICVALGTVGVLIWVVYEKAENETKLLVEFEDMRPFVTKNIKVLGTDIINDWYRLRIKNIGETTAKNVYSRLMSIKRLDSGQPIDYDPHTLHWVGMRPVTSGGKQVLVREYLPRNFASKDEDFVDLFYVDYPQRLVVIADDNIPRGNIGAISDSGKYRFKINVFCDNAEIVSIEKTFTFTFGEVPISVKLEA
ncbi:MAG: hypothetical protein NTZ73_00320 [Candidatus Diapherotrites archaeon]|nr:hypothetical protein [Candidatus Diapherotrites archaeon]